MSLGAIGAFLLVLIVVFLVGNLWFHLVEGVLARIRRSLSRKEPPAWHSLPPDWEDKQDKAP